MGIDEQVRTALVAAQLDFGKMSELLDELRSIQVDLAKISTGSLSLSRGMNRRIADDVARALVLLIEAFDERNMAATARVRALQDAIMNRLAIVDALEAKVAVLEQQIQGR